MFSRSSWLLSFALLAGCSADVGSIDSTEADAMAAAEDAEVVATSTQAVTAVTLPCFADAGKAAGDKIKLKLVPNRVSGVAPLSVFFDTVGTTATATSRPFHELAYCWNFGDASSGTFAHTGFARNEAKGPVAAHVFEKPGTYTVTVNARDAAGLVTAQAVEITVQDPAQTYKGTNTVCFSGSGTFTGCPSGATQVKSSQLTALNSYVATGRRLLLRRGETFTGGKVTLNVAGPGTIGAFGDGAKPKINTTTALFRVSGSTPKFSDWRIMDLDVNGQSSGSSLIVGVDGGARELTLLRVAGANIGGGLTASLGTINALNKGKSKPLHDAIDGLTIQDSDLKDLVGGGGHNFVFAAAHRIAMLGNKFFNSKGGEHVVRLTWADRAVLSNNDFGEAPSPRHILKIHAPQYDLEGTGKGKYTERFLLSDNILRGSGGMDWMVALTPQNKTYDERLRDLIVERNFFLPGPAAQVAVIMSAQQATVRSNVFHRGNHTAAVKVEVRGIEPKPENITLDNNTVFGTGTNGPTLVEISSGSKNVIARNNLVSGSKKAGKISSGAVALASSSNNLATMSPGFVVASPSNWQDFELKKGSAAIDAGSDVGKLFWDFAGEVRPAGGKVDLGALEYIP